MFLWWLAANGNLSREAREAVRDADRVFVSAASVWEISIKVARGRLRIQGDIREHLQINRFHPLPVTVAHAVAAGKLPRHHGDPFDRMLVAQAAVESLTLVTADREQAACDVPIIWA